jgi:hypothetical protein
MVDEVQAHSVSEAVNINRLTGSVIMGAANVYSKTRRRIIIF